MGEILKSVQIPVKSPQHRPPSYFKYKAAHPVIGITLTTELRLLTDASRGNLSYRAFFQKLLTDGIAALQPVAIKNAYQKGFKTGEATAIKNYQITIPCALTSCGRDIIVLPGDEIHEEILKECCGWLHSGCSAKIPK